MNQCKDCQFYIYERACGWSDHKGYCEQLTNRIVHNLNEICPDCDNDFPTKPNARVKVYPHFSCAYFTQKHEVVDSEAIATTLEPCIFCNQLPDERVQWIRNDELDEPNTETLHIVMCRNMKCLQRPSVYRYTQTEVRQLWNELNSFMALMVND